MTDAFGGCKVVHFPLLSTERSYVEKTRKYAKRRVKGWKRTYLTKSYRLEDYGWTHPTLTIER